MQDLYPPFYLTEEFKSVLGKANQVLDHQTFMASDKVFTARFEQKSKQVRKVLLPTAYQTGTLFASIKLSVFFFYLKIALTKCVRPVFITEGLALPYMMQYPSTKFDMFKIRFISAFVDTSSAKIFTAH